MDISIHEAERIERRGRRLVSGAILGAITLIAASWLGLFVFLGANTAEGTLQDLRSEWIPEVESMTLEFPNLSQLSTVYTADGVLLGELTERNSQPVQLDDIPNLVIGAVLSAEDADFMTHGGIDYRAVARAVLEDLGGGPRQGGSTITQQVVKQNFIGSEPTLKRKVAEAAIAIELERRFSKEQILEFYLNSVYFGENAYGVAAAADEYFGKQLDQLTIAEAAALPVPIRNPSLYNLRNDSEIPERARDGVIDQMVEEGYITFEEGETAKEDPIVTVVQDEFQDPAPQVLNAAKDTVLNDARYGLGATYLQRTRALFGCPADAVDCEGGGGLKIFTTVDNGLQEQARSILQDWLPPGSDSPTGAIAMVDNRTGAQVVMASGLDFGTDIAAGQRQYDLATKGRRNAGSAFKPFGLIAALENGITLGSYWDYSTPQELEYPGGARPWVCNNAGDNDPGIRTLEEALYLSTNTVFCQVSIAVGPDKIVEVAHRLGINSPLGAHPSIVLGAVEVSPLEMAIGYSTIANQGARVDSYLIERIEDSAGNVIYQHQTKKTQVLEPALAAAVVNTMEQVITRGTVRGGQASIGRPQAGKTGTNDDYKDAWFVGFIPQYTTAVWVGFADATIPMRNVNIGGELRSRVFGSTVAPIWREFMQIVTADLAVEDFPPDPDGIGVYYQTPRVEVPDVIGLEFEEAEEMILKAGFELEVTLVNSDEPEDTVVATMPEAGERLRQGSTVEVEVSNGLSPTAVLPDLLGRTEAEVNQILLTLQENSQIAFTWVFQDVPTDDEAEDGLAIATTPGVGDEIGEETTIVVSLGRYEAPATTTTTTTIP
jgi:penicillin-binding protein 1A